MAYNKSKFVEAAQKLLNQGKVAQAIAEYQQILKYEPRDQVTLMTIGELYIRQGETIQAIDYFERLAQLFVTDGFLTKAIAVYKRIAKLAPEEIRPLEKLADLYVQQGVMSEARPLFLQLAELHLKNNKQPEAVALLKKLLSAEPDNLRIQIRLADLYQAMGQSGEALETYVSAAQRALARGEQAECEKLADKALQINPKQVDALIVKARAYSTAGNVTQATALLEKVPDLEKGGEPAELLLDLYLKNAKWDEATALALRIFSLDEKNFGATQKATEALLEAGQAERAMSLLSRIRIPMTDAGEHEGVAHLLTELAARLPGRLEPLEWLVDTFGRTSDSFRLPDALAQLGDALVASGKLERARDVFQQLVDREPESDGAKRKLNDVLKKLGMVAEEASPPADVVVVTEDLQTELPKAPVPKLRPDPDEPAPVEVAESPTTSTPEPELDEETQKFIAQSLTDVDLFASYGLTQKAIGLLEAILRRAPTHTPTLEKLLDFVLGAGDDRRTAELAAQLEHIHAGRGDARSSERFGELRRRFQRAAGLTDDEIAAAVAAAMPQPVETLPVEEVHAEASVPATVEAVEEPAKAAIQAVEPAEKVSGEEVPEIEITNEPAAEEVSAPASAAPTAKAGLSEDWASLLEETKEPEPKTAKAGEKPAVPAESEEEEIPMSDLIMEEEAPAEAKAEETKHEELVPACEDTGHSEFVVPMESVDPEGWEVPQEAIPSEPPAPGAAEHAEKKAEHTAEPLLPDEEPTALPIPEHAEIASEGHEPALEEPQAALPEAPASEPEFELDREFELILEPEAVVPPHELMSQVPPPKAAGPTEKTGADSRGEEVATPTNGHTFSSDKFLSDLAKEIDELGLDALTPATSHPDERAHTEAEHQAAAEAKREAVSASAEPGPLKEVFEEFRAELGEMGAEDEDLETHYNLGIAFREMGLLEEAIGEFQKVAKANDRGKAFRYAMQCSTLLGLAFMEKGQPNIAAIWYERALNTPGIDSESKLALRYDLGVAQESAGDLESALKSFSQVYAINIDYRDVAERISSLQKPAR
ncbi:MAG TPA: tetratricopeptide repeat protein [Candidatus Sulfotelmatobacter sp.]|nr:tetratricopeptide repeat protein [Candidatus Sulfotelmatobacter sp.]